jgi:hypothetical protein
MAGAHGWNTYQRSKLSESNTSSSGVATKPIVYGEISNGGRLQPDVRVELLDEKQNTLQVTTTDFNGNYVFRDLQPGRYWVWVAPSSSPSRGGILSQPVDIEQEGQRVDLDLSPKEPQK